MSTTTTKTNTQYSIRQTRYFYGPQKTKDLVGCESGSPIIWGSRRDALRWIADRGQATYHLSHGEHSRPTYTLVPVR